MRKVFKSSLLFTVLMSILTLPVLTGCETYDDLEENGVSRDGVLPLDKVQLNMRESTFKEALVSFERDEKAIATVGGKSQYLSRERTPAGGQYMVECIDGSCFKVQILYTGVVSKEAALSLSKMLLPRDAPPLAKVDGVAANNQGAFSENYFYGDECLVVLVYQDKAATQVKQITALYLPGLKNMQAKTAEDLKARSELLKGAPGKQVK